MRNHSNKTPYIWQTIWIWIVLIRQTFWVPFQQNKSIFTRLTPVEQEKKKDLYQQIDLFLNNYEMVLPK